MTASTIEAPTLSARLLAVLALVWLGAFCLLGNARSAALATSVSTSNQAQATYFDLARGFSGAPISNTVTARISPRQARLFFYTDGTYSRAATIQMVDRRLMLEADAAACNKDSNVVESMLIRVWSNETANEQFYFATETSAASGLFRTGQNAWSRSVDVAGAESRSKQVTALRSDAVQVQRNDIIAASADACGEAVTAHVLVDPAGVVFDANTSQAIAGARVRLIDVTGAGNGGDAGGLAKVFDIDGVTPVSAELVSGLDGRYMFPMVAPSSYRLDVTPPAQYKFPSAKRPDQFAAGHDIVATGSYGLAYPVDATTGPVMIDLPLDPLPRALFVQKIASRTTVEIAESLQYTVVVKNAGDFLLDAVTLADNLPAGFAYMPGTARLDGVAMADPSGGRGPALTFELGAMASSTSKSLAYFVKVGPGALQGDGVNRAQAASTSPVAVTSNQAIAAVKVEAGVFTDKAMVLGTVYADCNGDGLQGAGEPGIPGVRLFLEDGTFVVTDGLGRYSIYGVRPRTHVLKVDATSLPAGATMSLLGQRNGGDGNSRFVDPRRGELHRADFALSACTPEIMNAVKARLSVPNGEQFLSGLLKRDLRADSAALAVGDVKALPSAGLIGEPSVDGSQRTTLNAAIVAATTRVSNPPASASMEQVPVPVPVPAATPDAAASGASIAGLESRLLALAAGDNRLEVLAPRDGELMQSSVTSIRTKAPSAAVLVLEVNGETIGDDRIGERARSEATRTELREYVGVPLEPGDNVISITERDPFGNVRGKQLIHVTAPGDLAVVKIDVPAKALEADGNSLATVRITLQDTRGLTVAGRRPVTLETSAGQWNVADLDAREPGVQTFIENGMADIALRAPAVAGDARLLVSTGAFSSRATIAFVPALRPMVAAGIVEGALNLRKLDPRKLVPARHDDGFEEELRTFATNGDSSAGARAAVFLKGKVRGDYLLTLGYDSDKDANQRLFRDIQPDEFYPVYGDASVKGYDAQSTSRLYVRVEKNKSSLLYGDFTTQGNASIQSSSQGGFSGQTEFTGLGTAGSAMSSPVRQLGAYQRSLTGIKEHYESDGLSANVFAARASSRQVIVELQGNGTSGPFLLNGGNLIENSEKVEILVRDRNQPALVVSTSPQVRFSDYDLEPLTGRLLFRAPVPSLDANLNPVSIRISFEVEQGAGSFWVAGADGQYRIGDRLDIGGSAVRDWNPLAPTALQSANASVRIAQNDVLTVEAAHIKHNGPSTNATTGELTDGSGGGAERIEWQHDGKDLKARAYAGRSDVGFDNQSSSLASGRSEAGLKASYAIDERTRVLAQGIHTAAVDTVARRDGLQVGVERSFDGGIKIEVGARHVHDVPAATVIGSSGETDTNSVRAKLGAIVPGLPLASVYGEVEQDVTDADKRMVAVGGDYRLATRGRLYARHELISSLSGPYALDSTQRRNSTVIGLDSDYMKDGRAFSEYRGRDAFSGREAEAAIGLRNLWTIAEGVRVNTSLERVQSLSKATPATAATAMSTDSAAVTAALEYTRNPLWKGTARIEVREASTTNSVLNTLGMAWKLGTDWTALAKNVIVATDNKGARANQLQERAQVGIAYRDGESNKMNGLARYEFKHERGMSTDEGPRTVHSVSSHADYQASRELILTTEYAGKLVRETIEGVRGTTKAHLLAGRATRDLGNNWDVGVSARVLADGHFGAKQYGVGGEVGYMVQKNMWMSAGYNVTGFNDRDLSAENYTNRGVYLRIRFKFDETLLGGAAS